MLLLTDLVDFEQEAVAVAAISSSLDALNVCDCQVIAHHLHFLAHFAGEFGPALPVILHTIR